MQANKISGDYFHNKEGTITNEKEELLALEEWVNRNISQHNDSLKPLDTGCHCGEECAAWYNLI
ncbi:hypothetical protein KJ918_04265 [Patescibacteria group bacterium]|nr:hypothetical protein [Patescibacteria group bacterium]